MRMNRKPMAYFQKDHTRIVSAAYLALGAAAIIGSLIYANIRDSQRPNILIRDEMCKEDPRFGVRYIDYDGTGRYDAGIDSVITNFYAGK